MSNIKIKITVGFGGATIEIDVDENITIKELKEVYAKRGITDDKEIKKAIFEAEFNLQLALGTKIPDDNTTLKDALLKGAVLKDEVIITAINITRPKPITDCLSAIKNLRLTVSPYDKLVKIAEILSREIGKDGENGTPILAKLNKEIVLAAVTQNGFALEYAPELQNDKEIVLEAVQQNGLALQYASENLRKDTDFMLAAVKQNVSMLRYVSEDLKGNTDFMLAAVKQNGEALAYASDELRNDPKIMFNALTTPSNTKKLEAPSNSGSSGSRSSLKEPLLRKDKTNPNKTPRI